MSQPAQRLPLSFEELYARINALPEGMTGEILEPGVLRTMSRPGKRHRKAARQLLSNLGSRDVELGGKGWWLEVEAELRLGERLVVPDLTGWRVERVPSLPDENPITIVPDWCCEVLSPRTQRDDKHLKLPLFARNGVPWVWLVDPEIRLLEVYATSSGEPILKLSAVDEEAVAPPPFDLPLTLGAWWLPA